MTGDDAALAHETRDDLGVAVVACGTACVDPVRVQRGRAALPSEDEARDLAEVFAAVVDHLDPVGLARDAAAGVVGPRRNPATPAASSLAATPRTAPFGDQSGRPPL